MSYSRKDRMRLGVQLLPEEAFQRVRMLASSELEEREILVHRAWARWGFQSVELPETFAAALMSTDSSAAMEGQKMPWPCFEIQVPAGLVTSSHGPVTSLVAVTTPPELQFNGALAGSELILCYIDTESCGFTTAHTLERLFEREPRCELGDDPGEHALVAEGLLEEYEPDVERRVWHLLKRLLAGVVLTINQARAEAPKAFELAPARTKHGEPRLNTHKLGRRLEVDCRAAVRAYMAGERRNSPALATLVRGHWRNQAHGPQWSLRRLQWIEPFFRGEGRMVFHTTVLKSKEPSS